MLRFLAILPITILVACASDVGSGGVGGDPGLSSDPFTRDLQTQWADAALTLDGLVIIDPRLLPGPASQADYQGSVPRYQIVTTFEMSVDDELLYLVYTDTDGLPVDVDFYDATDTLLIVAEADTLDGPWDWFN